MQVLDSFSRNYCKQIKVKVGDEYKVVDLEHDPFYGQMPEEYRKQLLREGQPGGDEIDRETGHLIKQITDYFTGEYTETTDEDFQEVGKDFFYHWYGGEIGVCKSEEVLAEEIKSGETRLDINEERCHFQNPYRLFKLVKRIDRNKGIYASIGTGIHYEIDKSIIPIVGASCNQGMNGIGWKKLIRDFIGCEQEFIITQKLASKRLLRKTRDIEAANRENEKLRAVNPIFEIDNTTLGLTNGYEPLDIANPEIPKGIGDNALNGFMTKAGGLGYMQNMNDKKERLTTGENFKDLHAVSNVQYRNLKELNQFGRQFNKFYPEVSLNFNVSNGGEAQGLPQGEFAGEEIDNQENNENNEEQKY